MLMLSNIGKVNFAEMKIHQIDSCLKETNQFLNFPHISCYIWSTYLIVLVFGHIGWF